MEGKNYARNKKISENRKIKRRIAIDERKRQEEERIRNIEPETLEGQIIQKFSDSEDSSNSDNKDTNKWCIIS